MAGVVADTRHFVVMANGTADFRTITDALKECSDGDTITVKIGQYDEKVMMDRSVNICGDEAGERGDVVVNGGFVCRAGGLIKHLSITNQVDIRAGDVRIEDCEISEGFDGVRICRDANPVLVGNEIHHARQGGDCIYFAEGSRGTVENNDIYSARVNAIHVNGGEAIVSNNRVRDSHFGIFLRRNARGTVSDNDISECQTFGIYIIQGADPVVERNRVGNCAVHTIMVSQEGMGQIRDNNLNGSMSLKKGSAATLGANNVTGRIENENVIAARSGSAVGLMGL
eukprot:TRINITY_DN60658_c0_g1_i1.p2 TRINITY_DN60658_c0_g1~~TRINITY_DN60658_c0_g1_i1.p2  ORF type:complete len:312 (+),score=102.72 TRINITY_DN60658_c0_g1_i1:87-938(+)